MKAIEELRGIFSEGGDKLTITAYDDGGTLHFTADFDSPDGHVLASAAGSDDLGLILGAVRYQLTDQRDGTSKLEIDLRNAVLFLRLYVLSGVEPLPDMLARVRSLVAEYDT